MTAPKLCTTCQHCNPAPSGNLNEATCDAVVDPFTGISLNVKVARLDQWQGLNLPCKYEGLLWSQKNT